MNPDVWLYVAMAMGLAALVMAVVYGRLVIAESPGTEAEMSLEAIALRSRAGKGPCQGSFCGIRICSYLYDRGHYTDTTGLLHMRNFFNERFKGQRPVVWGGQAAQMLVKRLVDR